MLFNSASKGHFIDYVDAGMSVLTYTEISRDNSIGNVLADIHPSFTSPNMYFTIKDNNSCEVLT